MTIKSIQLALHQMHPTNMKYLGLIMLLFLSKFTSGQNSPRVYTTFDNVAVFDDFSYITNRWAQKSSSAERFIISDKKYTVSRVKNTYFSVTLAKDLNSLSDFELITSIEVEKSKENKKASGGVVLKAQKSGNGALVLEINNKRQYRINALRNGVMKPLFGDKNDGWIKSKYLNKTGINEIKIATRGGEYDVYFNNQFERSFIETSFKSGRLGFFANAQSTLIAHVFILKINGSLADKPKKEEKEISESGGDDTYTELVKVFKAKIDKQQAEIERLTYDLNICQANLAIDTTSASKVKVLEEDNKALQTERDRLEEELKQAKKRLTYLESMKEDIESQTNGDLILHLTGLLSKEKDKNKALEQQVEDLKKEIGELRRRN
jgi:hypothetical protein